MTRFLNRDEWADISEHIRNTCGGTEHPGEN